jgi:undecaprenyl-diphosphatase
LTISEIAKSIDLDLLYFANKQLASPILDATMPTVTGTIMWVILALIVVACVRIYTRSNNVFIFCGLCLVCVGIADGLSYQVFKYMFARPRPCYTLADLRMIVGCGGTFGFPSNHATNAMTMAVFTFLVFRKRWAFIGFAVALLVSFSRVYLGVHYPSDVLGGMILGAAIATIIFYFLRHNKRFSFLVDPNAISGRNRRPKIPSTLNRQHLLLQAIDMYRSSDLKKGK